jgi:DNA-binding NarL/FixJ family response regulator
MRHPRVVVYEQDGLLARRLEPARDRNRWALREPRRPEEVLELLREPGPGVLLLRVGRDPVREMTLLEQVGADCPDVPAVVVADGADPGLVALAWDLGARFVLVPPLSWEVLEPVVNSLLRPGGEAPAASAPGGEP